MSSDTGIKVQDLGKCYQIYDHPRDRLWQMLSMGHKKFYKEFWALRNISFEVKRGETLGIIGRNGSGKSTLLQLICGTLNPTVGNIQTFGRIAALLELGAGFNFEFTGRENVFMNSAVLGLSPREIKQRFEQIEAFADIGDFMDQPVKTYSSGMFVRLAFAVQAHIDASVVLIDEALAVGDVFFRQKCYSRLEQLKSSGTAVVLVSHSMPDIEQYCERALLLDHGVPIFIGSAGEAAKRYYLLHQTGHDGGVQSQPVDPAKKQIQTSGNGAINLPPAEAFVDLLNRSQVSYGRARCIRFALCNAYDEPCSVFKQGDKAVFYYEFELSNIIGVPICGLVLFNDRGIIVYGKNSWQFDNDVPVSCIDSKVICRHQVYLNLGPGEYTFELGLASIPESDWKNRKHISHEQWDSIHITECVVTNLGPLSIGFACKDGVYSLTHHGIADLPGEMITEVKNDSK